MESLLKWGIENTVTGENAGETVPLDRRTDLDSAIIDHILGKSDAVVMKETLAVAVDESQSEEDRVQALDNFEMLIESIDNANNIDNMSMWAPLHNLITSPTTPESVKTQALWVIGTAVQNNPSAQTSCFANVPIKSLLSFVTPSNPPETRSKAVYALSGLLKHHAVAVAALAGADGWRILKEALRDQDVGVRRKVAFMLNSILIPTASNAPARPKAVSAVSIPAGEEPMTLTFKPAANPGVQGIPSKSSNVAFHVPPAEGPVHPNSHASMISDPTSTETSSATYKAFTEDGLLDVAIEALVGEGSEVDADYSEKIVRLLHTYTASCGGTFTANQKKALNPILASKDHDRWNLSSEELEALKAATV